MPVVFYMHPWSSPCRAVQMLTKILNIPTEIKTVNFTTGEQFDPEYLKINPLHTVPSIEDSGHIITESRVILIYLSKKFGPHSPIYPKDPEARSKIQQMLFFDLEYIYPPLKHYFYPQITHLSPADPEKEKAYIEAMETLNKLIDGKKFLTGGTVTIADLSVYTELLVPEAMGYKHEKFPNVKNWMTRMKKHFSFNHEVNEVPLDDFKHVMKQRRLASA